MSKQTPERAEKLKKFHMVLCGAGVGSLVARGIEQIDGGYSLPIQLACMVAGLVLAHFAVKRFYKSKLVPSEPQPGQSTANP